jgi:hypothetical protein
MVAESRTRVIPFALFAKATQPRQNQSNKALSGVNTTLDGVIYPRLKLRLAI